MRQHVLAACCAICLSATPALSEGARFETPFDAVQAMIAALQTEDKESVLDVFGTEAADYLAAEDPVENQLNRLALLALYAQGYRLVPAEDGSVSIALGEESWVFPVPIAQNENGTWSFDNEAGREEVIAREIGRNELDVIELLTAYVAIQSDFRQTDYDGDGVMEFAQNIISSSVDAPDGLFWPAADTPLGELFARASASGYNDGSEDRAPEPFAGYYFRILTGQGEAAPGGAMDYVVNGNMIGGHALLAVPAFYGESGVHSFLVSENGIVFEAVLGEDTLDTAAEISVYNPTEEWTPVRLDE